MKDITNLISYNLEVTSGVLQMQDGAKHGTAQYSSDNNNNFLFQYLKSLVHIVLGVLLV